MKNNSNNKKIQPYKIHFEIISKPGILISTTVNYWNIIINIKHPTLKGREASVKETLEDPDKIRVSKKDKSVLLFYKKFHKRHLCAAVKTLKERGYIITAYWTDKIKEGELKWKK